MAIWQFTVEFVPRKNLINYFGKIPKVIGEEIYWNENFCNGVNLPKGYEAFLSSLGEKEKLKWTEKSYNWGDYDDGTHITIGLQNENKVNIFARFDVEKWDETFIKTVLEFAKLCDCVLISLNRTIFEPELDSFIEELKQSNSYKFCKNPIAYLQSDEVKQLNKDIKKKLADNEFDFNS